MNTSNGSIRATSRTSGGARTKNLAEKIAALGEKRGRYQALLAQPAEDPWAHEKTPDRLRATNGPIEDIRKYLRAGNPYYQPSAIIVPVLLPYGEWDIDVPIKLALAYFRELQSAPYRRWTEEPNSKRIERFQPLVIR
jgi:pimeloyl-ACP methyl ester carboxylesterase